MDTQPTYDDVLLYWSGEATPDEAARVQERLRRDPEARAYLEELRALQEGVAGLESPDPGRSFAAEAVARHRPAPAGKVSRFPVAWLAAAAAVVLLAGAAIKFLPSGREEPAGEIAGGGAVEVPQPPSPPERSSSRPKLSERLFASRQRPSASSKLSAARDRAKKLRTQLNTKNTT